MSHCVLCYYVFKNGIVLILQFNLQKMQVSFNRLINETDSKRQDTQYACIRRNQDFAKGGGGLKNGNFCDVILMT